MRQRDAVTLHVGSYVFGYLLLGLGAVEMGQPIGMCFGVVVGASDTPQKADNSKEVEHANRSRQNTL